MIRLFSFNKLPRKNSLKGFTLIEVVVSIFLFLIVMLVAAGALLSIIDANKKSHTIKSVMDNFNFILEDLARNARMGNSYAALDCDPAGDQNFSANGSCMTGSTGFKFVSQRNRDTIQFQFQGGNLSMTDTSPSGVEKTISFPPSIKIEDAKFYVFTPAYLDQPRVIIGIRGSVGSGKYQTRFAISTSITKR